MLVEVEILGCVITAQFGTLSSGDILRTDAAFAAHLVNECAAARYTQAKPAPETVTAATKPIKRK